MHGELEVARAQGSSSVDTTAKPAAIAGSAVGGAAAAASAQELQDRTPRNDITCFWIDGHGAACREPSPASPSRYIAQGGMNLEATAVGGTEGLLLEEALAEAAAANALRPQSQDTVLVDITIDGGPNDKAGPKVEWCRLGGLLACNGPPLGSGCASRGGGCGGSSSGDGTGQQEGTSPLPRRPVPADDRSGSAAAAPAGLVGVAAGSEGQRQQQQQSPASSAGSRTWPVPPYGMTSAAAAAALPLSPDRPRTPASAAAPVAAPLMGAAAAAAAAPAPAAEGWRVYKGVPPPGGASPSFENWAHAREEPPSGGYAGLRL